MFPATNARCRPPEWKDGTWPYSCDQGRDVHLVRGTRIVRVVRVIVIRSGTVRVVVVRRVTTGTSSLGREATDLTQRLPARTCADHPSD